MGKGLSGFFGALFGTGEEQDAENEEESFEEENSSRRRGDKRDRRAQDKSGPRVVNINSNYSDSGDMPGYAESVPNMSMCVPKVYGDLNGIIAKVMKGEHIIIKFDEIDEHNGQRILDYVSGTCYALGAHVSTVAKNTIYLVTPKTTKLDNSLLDKKSGGDRFTKAAKKDLIIDDNGDF